jgi:hypothetical protein
MATDLVSFKNMPSDKITIACFTYMARIMELSDFSSYFFGIVLGAENFSRGLTEESKKTFIAEAVKYQITPGSFPPSSTTNQ